MNSQVIQSIYGILLSLGGLAVMVWLPAEPWIRILSGWFMVLLGGVMVSPAAVKEWLGIVIQIWLHRGKR